MKAWQDAHIQLLLDCDSEEKLFARILDLVRRIGFEYCAYGIRLPLPVSNPRVLMLNNYSKAWQDSYENNKYLKIDPTVAHGIRSTMPMIWTDDVFEKTPRLWDEARAHGLRFGWAQSSRDTHGTIGMLTLARGHDQLETNELEDKLSKMSWLTQIAHIGMSRHIVPKYMPEAHVKLSSREVEVLRWTAEGKTSADVAEILRISERTVNFHVNNAMSKLGVSNKTQAAIYAAVLGFLF